MRFGFYFILLFFFFYSFKINAQSGYEDVVYLKNGGVTRGTILELIPDTTVKIQTKDRNIFVYKFSEIDKILKEPLAVAPKVEVASQKPQNPPKDDKTNSKDGFKKEGFHNITKLGPAGFTSYSINMINGYQFNPYFLLGLGVGLDAYKGLQNNNFNILLPDISENLRSTTYFLPVYLDVRYHVSDSRATFLVFFDMGYSVLLGEEVITNNANNYTYYNYYSTQKGDTFICPGIGFKVFLNKRVGIVVDFGTKFQNYTTTNYSYNSVNSTSNRTSGMIVAPVLNFGLGF